jgi:hypothetical protein
MTRIFRWEYIFVRTVFAPIKSLRDLPELEEKAPISLYMFSGYSRVKKWTVYYVPVPALSMSQRPIINCRMPVIIAMGHTFVIMSYPYDFRDHMHISGRW